MHLKDFLTMRYEMIQEHVLRLRKNNIRKPKVEHFLKRAVQSLIKTMTCQKRLFFNPVTNLTETEVKNPDILKGLSEEAEESSSTNDNHLKTEALQKRQKLLEEENKVKRQLLTKAIADRRQKTTDESKKLQQVQNELQKMDQLVANDVRFLRKTIEEASFQYNDAQKRYDKAEKEFVAAKLNLHKKQDRKELLTEHLATIIEDSEVRKAGKLNELMSQLQL